MINHIPESHFRYRVIPEVARIAEPVYKDTGYIKFIGYVRQYDNKNNFDLLSSKEWAKNFYDNYLFDKENTKKRLKVGINLWKNNRALNITQIREDAHDNFNIDARIEFVRRDEMNKCYHLYAFYTQPEHAEKAYRFYDFHRGKLLNFIAYFNKEASNLMFEGTQKENLIEMPDYDTNNIEDPRRNYAKELFAENKDTKVTSRQTEIAILYAAGFTIADVGKMINVAKQTVNDHLKQFSKKHGIKFERDRRKLKEFVKAKGWEGLEQFFFNFEGLPPLSETVH